MDRRQVLSLLAVSAPPIAGGVAAFRPAVILGAPRGSGEPISVEKTVTDDSIRYQPSSDTIRYPETTDRGGSTEYRSMDVERWANHEGASTGIEAVVPTIRGRLETAVDGLTRGLTWRYVGWTITVTYSPSSSGRGTFGGGSTSGDDGESSRESIVPFEEIVEATPRSVHATVRLEGREQSTTVPVFVLRGGQTLR